jgi:uncharacterized RDD family membrane protein YckC
MDKDYFADAYSPPGSDVNAGVLPGGAQGAALAERGTRLAAATLDGLLITVPLLPLLAVGIYLAARAQVDFARAGVDETFAPASQLLVWLEIAGALGLFGALGIAIYQWILISRTGQSLGKKWTGIRIEMLNGERVTFGTGVALRNWVPKVIGAVPYLGMIFHLIDCLYIFREDRRCVHDHIAGTRVVLHQR